jgi:3-oxoacyl-[acyl-carrier-protein] synthase-3
MRAHSRVALASIAGIGINRPAADAPLARRVSGSEVTGVSYRVQTESGVTTASLAAGAARAALRAAQREPSDVDLVLVGTTSPDVMWPSTACLVQTELRIPTVFALDLYAAQASFLTALNVARHYVPSYKTVLLIGADCDRQLVDLAGQGTLVRARAAAATVLCPADGNGGILSTMTGGAAKAASDGQDAAEVDVQELAHGVQACLRRADLAQDDIDLVFGDQSYPELMRVWARHAGISEDRLVLDPDRYGSLLAAGPGILLHDAVNSGRLQPGMQVLVLECGSGAVWSAACLHWGKTRVAAC